MKNDSGYDGEEITLSFFLFKFFPFAGITPECVAALDRAESLTLDGVYHSPLGKPKGVPWYGDDEVVDHWVHWLLSD